jgi:hypothetical protein
MSIKLQNFFGLKLLRNTVFYDHIYLHSTTLGIVLLSQSNTGGNNKKTLLHQPIRKLSDSGGAAAIVFER